ncbi:Hly-III family protein [Beutenbergia cavernae DSM 12333]|uniref:Hly-III family protein n=1 Tax=Beutenbergia cavernae (strain ATCC BAA-8 / DSM 12333 / CCUG 43141 / JCM 11478 / NBRC 16432 / NCIMB 13614 / HKI 0122) TaxID=471853 RepID=C5C0T9_BEUC1|nr:hemolysin III family protein [Beutenbergia cavernae]ACQ79343.1 Hly-III family protein [Beutenbergia cavernae DSM 12333]
MATAQQPGTGDPAPSSGAVPHDSASDEAEQTVPAAVVAAIKPHLRGWIHAGMTPFVVAAGIVLVALSPTPAARVSTGVFALATTLLFTMSAVYHRGTWSARVAAVLRRFDHANIFLVIAGTYTPLAVLLLPTSTATTLLLVVWGGALAGILARVFWLGAPRWLYVPIYLALGWVAVWFLPAFGRAGSPAIMWLVIAGGLGYTAGAVVYALKRPNPSPRWFGFHEIFHVGTLIGYVCHYIAVAMASFALR